MGHGDIHGAYACVECVYARIGKNALLHCYCETSPRMQEEKCIVPLTPKNGVKFMIRQAARL